MRIESDVIKTGVALLVLGVICVAAVWVPKRVQTRQLRERITNAQTLIDSSAGAAAQLAAVQEKVRKMETDLKRNAKIIPEESALPELMRSLHSTLSERAVKELRLLNRDEFRGSQYNIVPLEFGFRGGFVDAFVFVEYMESLQRLLRIDQFRVQGEIDDDPDALEVIVKISTFYAPSNDTKAAAVAAAPTKR